MKKHARWLLPFALTTIALARCNLDDARNTYCVNHPGVCQSGTGGGTATGTGGGNVGGGDGMGGGGGIGTGGEMGGGMGGDAGTDAGMPDAGILDGGACPPLVGTGGAMSGDRIGHTATLTPCGQVLVFGGYRLGAEANASAEIYDLASNKWYPAASAPAPRARHSAAVLGDGRVLFAGGTEDTTEAQQTLIYSNGVWSHGPAFPEARTTGAQLIAYSGTAIVVDGNTTGPRLRKLNLSTNVWEPLDQAAIPVIGAALALVDHTLWSFGGEIGGTPSDAVQKIQLDGATPAWEQLVGVTLWQSRLLATATPLTSGFIIIAGGVASRSTYGNMATFIFNPVGPTVTNGSLLNYAPTTHTATALSDTEVLVAGGADNSGFPSASATIMSTSQAAVVRQNMPGGRDGHTATVLPDGSILFTGGTFNQPGVDLATRRLPNGTWVSAP
ncbi:MAG: hypothetical protein K1X64_16365 [Myxococcaceae bacterium]|nr:hypothetical protein [Myxococcaceae bacterium]